MATSKHIEFKFKGDIKDLNRAFGKINRQIGGVNKKLKRTSLVSAGAYLGVGQGIARGVGMAIRGMARSIPESMKYAADVKENLNEMFLKMPDSELFGKKQEVSSKAILRVMSQIANTTKITQDQIAKAGKTFAKAGKSSREIYEMITPAAQLSLATSVSFEEAVSSLMSTMNTYGLKTKDSNRIILTMVKSANMANMSFGEMAYGYRRAGALLKAGNMTFEETAGLLTVMADAGIKSSLADTALRNMGEFMVGGRAKHISDSLKQQFADKNIRWTLPNVIMATGKAIKDTSKRAAMFKEMFGARGMAGALTTAEGVEKLFKNIAEIQGADPKLVNKMVDGLLKGTREYREMASAADELRKAWGDMWLNALKPVHVKLKAIFNTMSEGMKQSSTPKKIVDFGLGRVENLEAMIKGDVPNFGAGGLPGMLLGGLMGMVARKMANEHKERQEATAAGGKYVFEFQNPPPNLFIQGGGPIGEGFQLPLGGQ